MSAGRVLVSAPSHLHAGNIDLHGGLGRLYGTLGFSLAQPRLVVVYEPCSETRVVGPDAGLHEWAVEALRSEYGLPGLCVRVLQAIPRGVGLGATTAAVLAAASAYNRLLGAGIDLRDAALAAGRSTVSALGFYSFTRGGAVLDGGFPVDAAGWAIPPLIARYELPSEWRFLVVLPSRAVPLVREVKEREDEVLAKMPRMDPGLAERLSRLLLMKLLPALAERDLPTLLEALTEFNSKLGREYWSSRQRGTYCCPLAEEAAELLRSIAGGVAQSSWGPAVYTILPSPSAARRAAVDARSWLLRRGGGMVYVSPPDNRGASVKPLG
jgi:beta-ribofuranosylaminobenzene 5'-phosphate synthase